MRTERLSRLENMAAKPAALEVEKILGRRQSNLGTEYLVHWKGQPQEKDEWKLVKDLSEARHFIIEYNRRMPVNIARKKKVGEAKDCNIMDYKLMPDPSSLVAKKFASVTNIGNRATNSKRVLGSKVRHLGAAASSRVASMRQGKDHSNVNLGNSDSSSDDSSDEVQSHSSRRTSAMLKRLIKDARESTDTSIQIVPSFLRQRQSLPGSQTEPSNVKQNENGLPVSPSKTAIKQVKESREKKDQTIKLKGKEHGHERKKTKKRKNKSSDGDQKDSSGGDQERKPKKKRVKKEKLRDEPKTPSAKNAADLVKKSIALQRKIVNQTQKGDKLDISKRKKKNKKHHLAGLDVSDTGKKTKHRKKSEEKVKKKKHRIKLETIDKTDMNVSQVSRENEFLNKHLTKQCFEAKVCLPLLRQYSNTSSVSTVSSTDSDNILYSLADAESSSSRGSMSVAPSSNAGKSPSSGHQAARRKLMLDMQQVKEHAVSKASSPSTESDPEITFKASPRKMLLKNSIRPKTVNVKPVQSTGPAGSVVHFPQSGSFSPSFKSPPTTPVHVSHLRDPSPSRASISNDLPRVPNIAPVLPNSPPAPRYESLVKNLYQGNRGVKRRNGDSGDGDAVIERRVSVRQSESAFKYKEIVVKKCQGYTQVWLFSQTKRKNALNPKVFQELIQALHNAKFDDSRVVLLTGSGSVFCSGIDLHYLLSEDNAERRTTAKEMASSMKDFLRALIAFPKPLVVAVNGPAIGLGVAILPLCDMIYASDKASFYFPYSKLGQTPEGGASFIFPQVMGLAMSNELLLAGRKVTAMEAYQMGLVSQVFWPTSMMQEVIPRIQQLAALSSKGLEASKILIRSHQRGKVQVTVDTECQMLVDRWTTTECQKAIQAYIDDDEDMML